MAALNCLEANWFPLLQGVGIASGLFFTGISIRREGRARQRSDILLLAQHHREIWAEVHRRPDLGRVLLPDVDLIATPISVAEQEFLNTAIVHFCTGWQLAKDGGTVSVDALRGDVGLFFKLPIPRAVWRDSVGTRDPEFVRFVEDCLPKDRASLSGE